MFNRLKDFIRRIFDSRLSVMIAVMVIFSVILLLRLFVLQIIKGANYQDNYDLMVEKTETIEATRGNIYDRNGELLAYNELAYAVTIEDNGSYDSKAVRNESLNKEIYEIITHLEANGDSIDNNFGIILNAGGQYEFTNTGTSLSRFLADVFGYTTIDELTYNKKLGFNEAEATPDQVMSYLQGSTRYNVSDEYETEMRYKITVVRYNMGQNSYQKYIATTIASDVSDETVAYIKENTNELTGVDIAENSIRKYVDSEYFAQIIGYTGTISTDEYNELSQNDKTVTLQDVIGKSGIEQYMNSYLSGTKGSETMFVDSVGNLIDVTEHKDSTPGNDVYLSLDKNLQVATYKLLEREIASIVYSKIQNVKEYNASSDSSASDIIIPIYDVYYSLVNNHLIDVNALNDADSSATEKAVYSAYVNKKGSALSNLKSLLNSGAPVAYNQLDAENQEYATYIVTMLKSKGIFDAEAIDKTDDVYKQWTSEALSVNEYLKYAIEQNWIDITQFAGDSKYADTDELYANLVSYILDELDTDTDFEDLVYKYVIYQDYVSGNQLCAILYDQGVLPEDEATYNALVSGSLNSFGFIKAKIKSLEITPGQLALDPCSGSCVITDTDTGEVLACVTYPGYDNNKLANSVDSKYYSSLATNQSNPLYNYATQQRTAPGSTFKLVTSTAGLAEGVITTSSTIQDLGEFDLVSNKPKCWYYPNTHGFINVSEAIRDSCNYFFYQVGWDLAGGSNYNDANGIEKIQKYASMYGLDEKTGIEIEENDPHIATEYPVMAAIGQSDNNYTTISLGRYVTAVANSGTVYNLSLLDHVADKNGNVIETYGPTVRNKVDILNTSQWASIHSGMRMVVESLSSFNGFGINVAGKTGTAQQVTNRPNHALFVGYAPYEDPKISIATRIAYGYTSHNAADVSKSILEYYFYPENADALLNGEVGSVNSSNSVTD